MYVVVKNSFFDRINSILMYSEVKKQVTYKKRLNILQV